MTGDVLYKRGFSHSYIRCLTPGEVDYVMREVHEGVREPFRSMFTDSQVNTSWILLAHCVDGHPVLCKGTQSYVRECDKCQRFSNVMRQPMEELKPMSIPYLFA